MEKFNYNTDRLVIVSYPMGAGGKFLINCLGVSDNACLQDWELYNLSSIEKKQLILDRLSATPYGTWNDLELGCFKMFEYNVDGLTADEIHQIEFGFQTIIDISNNNKYFFQTTHTEKDHEQLCCAFPNATTINFTNSRSIHRNICKPIRDDLTVHSDYTFDVDNYNNIPKLLEDIRMFYSIFGMQDFDNEFVTKYYLSWQDKING